MRPRGKGSKKLEILQTSYLELAVMVAAAAASKADGVIAQLSMANFGRYT